MPAHTAAWGKAYPDIIAACDTLGGNMTDVHLMDKYALNPIVDHTYTVLEAVIGEVAKLFPDKYLHIGGDEFHFE